MFLSSKMDDKTSETVKMGDWFRMFDQNSITTDEDVKIDVTKPIDFDKLFQLFKILQDINFTIYPTTMIILLLLPMEV